MYIDRATDIATLIGKYYQLAPLLRSNGILTITRVLPDTSEFEFLQLNISDTVMMAQIHRRFVGEIISVFTDVEKEITRTDAEEMVATAHRILNIIIRKP